MASRIRYKRSPKPRKDRTMSVPKTQSTSAIGFLLITMGWIIPLLGVWFLIVSMGMPALRWQYSYQGTKSSPYYTQCDYVSFHNGVERVIPNNGSCPLIALRPNVSG